MTAQQRPATRVTSRRPRRVLRRATALLVVGFAAAAQPAGRARAEEAPPADLSVAVVPSTSTARSGDFVVWSVTVTNSGPGIAANLAVLDQMPDSLDVVSVTPTGGFGCVTAGSELWCTADSLAAGTAATIVVTVAVAPDTSAQVVVGSATVSSTTADPDATDNHSTGSLEVVVDAVSQGPVPVPRTPSEPGTLPETGGSTTVTLATAAVLFLLAGATALVPSRRRRRGDGQLDV